ncbi:hypothetical protein LIER_08571 [Lithospermum erythrorhizon]|uniref:Uncharacterized protein n=1 Tax=Lithospermum erythrorhizon TaxID=34254 RepID=A0AAV3PE44_LITER
MSFLLYSNELPLRKLSCEGSVHGFVIRPPVTKEIHGRKPRVLLQLSNVDFYHSDRWKYGRVISDNEFEDEEAGEYEVTNITDNDTIFFREMDTFDDKLDKEIKEENIELQRKEAEEIENIARENEMEMRYVESESSIPKKKFVGTYARHGEEF